MMRGCMRKEYSSHLLKGNAQVNSQDLSRALPASDECWLSLISARLLYGVGPQPSCEFQDKKET
ncbi:MAG: hypothetical protein MZU79_09240 [Anaerotruncus sp.]|nr:hypothetical protein [Anaerotruncus sp.]